MPRHPPSSPTYTLPGPPPKTEGGENNNNNNNNDEDNNATSSSSSSQRSSLGPVFSTLALGDTNSNPNVPDSEKDIQKKVFVFERDIDC